MSQIEPLPGIGKGRCGCGNYDCSCEFVSTSTVTVVGNGSAADPFEFILEAEVALQVLDTPSVDLTLSGSGDPDDPWVLSGEVTTGIPTQTTIFTGSGSYNIPAGAELLGLRTIGGGGGGGGGQVGANGATRYGGAGGGGGAMSEVFIPVADIPGGATELDIFVGSAGGGGAGGVSGGGTGFNGSQGGDSSVRVDGPGAPLYYYLCRSAGGYPGLGGGRAENPTWMVRQMGMHPGGYSQSQVGALRADSAIAPGGGGHGAGLNDIGQTLSASAGGLPWVRSASAGQPFTGGAGAAAPGGVGNQGALYGSGGGGGGGRTTGGVGGAGASGRPGLVIVTVW